MNRSEKPRELLDAVIPEELKHCRTGWLGRVEYLEYIPQDSTYYTFMSM
jgi:hypothetical protein